MRGEETGRSTAGLDGLTAQAHLSTHGRSTMSSLRAEPHALRDVESHGSAGLRVFREMNRSSPQGRTFGTREATPKLTLQPNILHTHLEFWAVESQLQLLLPSVRIHSP